MPRKAKANAEIITGSIYFNLRLGITATIYSIFPRFHKGRLKFQVDLKYFEFTAYLWIWNGFPDILERIADTVGSQWKF